MTADRTDIPGPRPAVAELSAYDPQHFEVAVNLSANENAFGLPESIRDIIIEKVRELPIHRYPDPAAAGLREAIADFHGIDAGTVAVGNGGDELLQALLLAYGGPGRTAVSFTPTFSMYEILSRSTGTGYAAIARDAAFDVPDDAVRLIKEAGADLVFICSPNNPTGNTIDAASAEKICRDTGGLIVVDEAYQEFSDSSVLDLRSNRNLAVLRTFSKAFSLAGLRVGYLIADREVIKNINKVRLPYNVNVLSQAVAEAIMRDPAESLRIVAEIKVERERTIAAVNDIDGFKAYPSQANFFLVKCRRPGDDVWRGLLDEGILVRNIGGAPGLKDCIRITVGTGPQNSAVVNALRKLR